MFTLRITVLMFIVPLNYDLCFCGCAHAEYEIVGQCCPMCAPGNRVFWSCTNDASTTCYPCPEFTYIDVPNGYIKCFPCTVCDEGQGLRVSKACTRSSDTVCEPLERFYCIERNKGSCRVAVQHSECSPGQYIKQTGTGSTDTVCADCKGDTYSDGSFSSCLPHTKCESLGKITVKAGTATSDAECSNGPLPIGMSVIGVCVMFIAIVIVVILIKKKKEQYSGASQVIVTHDG